VKRRSKTARVSRVGAHAAGLRKEAIAWTTRLELALADVRTRERRYVPGRDPSAPLDLAKVALADALLAAIAAAERLAQLPARARPARAGLRPPARRRTKHA
jgi:hypothetical protein